MRNKTVAHVLFALNFGGVETRMKTIAKNSRLSKFQHHFCALSKGGSISRDLISMGANVQILGQKVKIPSIKTIFALLKYVSRERPDILHCHGAEANFHGIIVAKLCGIPVVGEEIGIPSHSIKARYTFRFLYSLCNKVVAVSCAVKQTLIKLDEVNEQNCEVVLSPFQLLDERSNICSAATFRICYVGRLEPVKNPLGLIHAVKLLHDKGTRIHLEIVGDGSQRKMAEDLVVRLKLNANVNFNGFVEGPFYKFDKIDLYVLPSFSEGLSNSLIEAMSAGIPSLTTAVGGAPCMINHGENGFLVHDAEPQSIANAIFECLSLSSVELQSIGENGRNSVIAKFSPEKYFDKIDNVYQNILDQTK